MYNLEWGRKLKIRKLDRKIKEEHVRDHIALFALLVLAHLPCVEREAVVYVMHPTVQPNVAGVHFTLVPCIGCY